MTEAANLEQGSLPDNAESVKEFITDEPQFRVEVAQRYLEKWVHTFGFGNFARTVIPMTKETAGAYWARAFVDLDEEWLEIEIVPDGVLPEEQVEFLICHELMHGLIDYADSGEGPLESACNRIARVLTGFQGANKIMYGEGAWRHLPDD